MRLSRTQASGDTPIDFAALPGWMRKVHFFDLARESGDTFVRLSQEPVPHTSCSVHGTRAPAELCQPRGTARTRGPGRAQAVAQAPGANHSTAWRGGSGQNDVGRRALATASEVVSAYDDGILWVTLGKTPNLVEVLGRLYTALTGQPSGFIDKEDGEYQRIRATRRPVVPHRRRRCLGIPAHLRPLLRGGANCFPSGDDASVRSGRRCRTARYRRDDGFGSGSSSSPLISILAVSTSRRSIVWRIDLVNGRSCWNLANAALRHRIGRGDTLEGALDYLGRKLDKQGVVAFDARNATERQQAIVRQHSIPQPRTPRYLRTRTLCRVVGISRRHRCARRGSAGDVVGRRVRYRRTAPSDRQHVVDPIRRPHWYDSHPRCHPGLPPDQSSRPAAIARATRSVARHCTRRIRVEVADLSPRAGRPERCSTTTSRELRLDAQQARCHGPLGPDSRIPVVRIGRGAFRCRRSVETVESSVPPQLLRSWAHRYSDGFQLRTHVCRFENW